MEAKIVGENEKFSTLGTKTIIFTIFYLFCIAGNLNDVTFQQVRNEGEFRQ